MTKIVLTFLAFTLCFCTVHAQRFDVSGKTLDSTGSAIGFASLSLANPTDSSTVHFTFSKDNGQFKFSGVEPGNYLLISAVIGYEVSYLPISVNKHISNLDIYLASAAYSLKEIQIKAAKVPMLINGDTLVYNAESFKTQSNATVEDLMKKLPGVQVEQDGTITAEGEQITKVYINGKEFFGGNVQAATKNLDASIVDKVEVIDKKSDDDEFTGDDNGQREKVINLVVKEELNRGYFGTVKLGYGMDYYDGHGNLNFFTQNTQLSIIGGGNNVDRTLYGWDAMSTLNTFEIDPFNNNSRTTWWNGGVNTYIGGGANIHTEPSDKLKLDLSYVYTDKSSIQNSDRFSEVYLTPNSLFNIANDTNTGDGINHQINTKLEFEADSASRVVFRAQLAKDDQQTLALSRSYNFRELASILNSGVNKDAQENGNEKLVSKIHWTRKNRKKMDNHFLGSLYYAYNQSYNGQNSYFNTDTLFLPYPSTENPLLAQRLSTKEQTIATTSAYQFKVTKKLTVRPGFNYMFSEYDHDYQWQQSDGSIRADLSPVGQVRAQNMEYFAHISYKLDTFTTLYVVPELNQIIEDRSFFTDSLYETSINQRAFIPYLFLRSQKPHKYNFNLNLRAHWNKPNITNLLPVTDNSNPYRTFIGNMDLKNAINYQTSASYRRNFSVDKYVGIWTWTSYAVNPSTTSNQITEENYSISKYVNAKNKVYSNWNANFSFPIKPLKAQVVSKVEYNYGHGYFFQNNEEIKSVNHGYSFGAELDFNKFEGWSFDLDYELQITSGMINGIANNDYLKQSLNSELIINPFDRLEWRTWLQINHFAATPAADAAVIPLLSSEINFFLDKNQKWALGVKGFDLLDKNQNLWRWWSGNSFTEYQSNAVRRYVMLNVTYKIKKQSEQPQTGGPVDRRQGH